MRDPHLTAEQLMYRQALRSFVEKEIVPHYEEWEDAGIVPRSLWEAAGALGFLGMDVPEEYGGMGESDYRFNALVIEEIARAGVQGVGFAVHTDMAVPYIIRLGTEAQKARWLPGVVDGTGIVAIAMTEPGAGSDLQAIRTTAVRGVDGDGEHYMVNGQKTFISNGILADVVIAAVKTDPSQRAKGMSLVVIERGMAGFERGRNLDKIGLHAQDTAELFFVNVRVPAQNLLGAEGQGFTYLMQGLARERLSLAVGGVANAEAVLAHTLRYVKERMAFGKPIGSFQHSRFVLAESATELEVARTFVDQCVLDLVAGVLTPEKAAMAKYWCSDTQMRVIDRCLQLHGGYGYMREYFVARAYVDARVQPIYGGTNEIMKEVIGRGLGL